MHELFLLCFKERNNKKKHLLFPLYLMAGALLCDSFSLEHIDKYNFIEMTEYWE